MARQSASQLRIYWDEHKISGYLNSLTQNVTQELPVVTSFEDAGPRVIPANYDYTHAIGGFGDYADNLIDEILATDAGGDDHYLGWFPLTTNGIPTEGSIGYEAVVAASARGQAFSVGSAALLSLSTQGSNDLTRSPVLRSGTVTAVANGTGVDVGTTTSGQTTSVVFRVVSGTFTSITMVVQESSDNGAGDAYVAVAGLTSGALTVPSVVRVTTTSATEAWKRVAVTAFTGTNAVVLVTAGRVAG